MGAYLVVYDISDDRKRAKVMRELYKYGYWFQYSSFYIPDITKSQAEKLFEKLKTIISPTDRLFFYPVEEIEYYEGYPYKPWEVFIL